METKDLLEFLVAREVVKMAQNLRIDAMEEEEAKTGKSIALKDFRRPIDEFLEPAAKLLSRRRHQIIPMLS